MEEEAEGGWNDAWKRARDVKSARGKADSKDAEKGKWEEKIKGKGREKKVRLVKDATEVVEKWKNGQKEIEKDTR